MGMDVVFEDNFARAASKIDDTIKERMLTAVNLVRDKTLETLSDSRTGRFYTVPYTRRTYQASAPGEAPAQRTGELRGSVRVGVENDGKEGYVGTDKDYGRMLEFGTSCIRPRPWLRKSFEVSSNNLRELFTRIWF